MLRCLIPLLFAAIGAASAVTPGEVSQVLGNPTGVTWELGGPNPGNWTVDSEYLRLQPVGAGETFTLSATVTGPGVLELSSGVSGLLATIQVDGTQSGGALPESEQVQRVQIEPGTHVIEWRMQRDPSFYGSKTAWFRLAKWETFSPVAPDAGAPGITLSGPWIWQNRWHHGDGVAAWSGVMMGSMPDRRLRAEFSGPGVLSHLVRVENEGGDLEIDGFSVGLTATNQWLRNYHPVGEGLHAAEWVPSRWPGARMTSELMVDEVEILPEISPEVALDTPGRVWNITVSSDGQAFGVAMEGAVGGAGMVLRAGGEITTQFAGGELLRIRANQELRILCDGEYVDVSYNGSEAEPHSEHGNWRTMSVEVPAGGGELSITSWMGEVRIDRVELVEKPADLETLLGLAGKGATIGGTWTIKPDPELGRYVATAELEEDGVMPWIEVPVTGPAKIRGEFNANPGSRELEWLVDGKVVWSETDSYSYHQEIHIELPEGNHVVRVRGFLPEDHPGGAAVSVAAFEILPMPDGGLGGGTVWAYSGGWEKTVIEGVSAIRPVAEAKFGGGMPSLKKLLSGPGEFRTKVYLRNPEEGEDGIYTAWKLKDSLKRHEWVSPSASDAGWSQPVGWWFSPGDHWVEWDLMDHSSLEDTAIAFPEFLPWIEVPFSLAMDRPGVSWTMSDPLKPWTAAKASENASPIVISPPLESEEASSISTNVNGPGIVAFRWNLGGFKRGEVRILANGEQISGSWLEAGVMHVPVSGSGPVELRIEFQSYDDGTWIEVSDFYWAAWEESPLAEALDTGSDVTWTTSGEHPAKGYPHPYAEGNKAAYLRLDEFGTTWIEATVEGPGLFDFRLLDAAGSVPWLTVGWYWNVDWELTVDGRKVYPLGETWPAIFVNGPGTHRIRLTVTSLQYDTFIGAVDRASWVPLSAGNPEGWSSDGSDGFANYASGGKDNAPVATLEAKDGEVRWMEKTVTGPGLLEWHEISAGGPNTCTLNGKAIVWEMLVEDWQKRRLFLPAGTHTVRWSVDRSDILPFEETAGVPEVKISGMNFTPGVTALAEALDLPGAHWFMIGEAMGSLVTGPGAKDGIDAWKMGEGSSLYFCNPALDVVKLAGWAFDEEEPGWMEERTVVAARETAIWEITVGYGFSTLKRERILDGVTEVRSLGTTLAEALDSAGQFSSVGWHGVATTDAADGIDAAWALWRPYENEHVLSLITETPKTIRFRWKKTGQATLKLMLNEAALPVGTPGEAWSTVEIKVGGGRNRIVWRHERPGEMEDDAAGEAWIDQVEIIDEPTFSYGSVVTQGALPDFMVSEGPWLQEWKPVKIGDGQPALRSVTGNWLLSTMVEGPLEITFSGRCFGPELPVGILPRSSVVVIGGGGAGPTFVGRELTLSIDGEIKAVIPADAGGNWTDATIIVPAGNHQLAWRLRDRMRTTGIGGPVDSHINTSLDGTQAWVRSIRVKSAKGLYDEWAAALPFPEGLSDPSDDADGDGVSNLLEYAAGSNALDAAVKPAPAVASVMTGQPYLEASGPSTYVLKNGTIHQFHVPFVSPKVRGVVESSADLKVWQEHLPLIPSQGSPFAAPALPVSGFPHITQTGLVMPWGVSSNQPARYFRVKVTLPE